MSTPFDPNRTAAMNPNDPNRTMAVPSDPNKTAMLSGLDPNKTQAMAFLPGGKSLTANLIPSRPATMANGPAREQFLLELIAHGAGGGVTGARTPLNLCLVIDKSGSMEGLPLEYVKHACAHVVDLLSPEDVLSIVTFEEIVELLMPPQKVTNKQAIKDGIATLTPGNTTDLHGGISLALQQVTQFMDPSRATRMVVLSDGDPTAGVKDFGSLVQFASDIKQRGVTMTFLGFGPDYNEELLAGMAKRSGGNYYFIPQPQMIPEIFRTELQKLMTVAARNLNLTLKPARWVQCKSHGDANSKQISIPLPDLERGATMSHVFDFEFPNHPLGWYRVAAGTLTYEDCATGKQEQIDLDFVIEFTSDAAKYSAPVNPLVRSAADVALASRNVEKTIMGLKQGQITIAAAVSDLQKTQMLLQAEGRTQEAQEVTMALKAIQTGDTGAAEKTLMGTMVHLDQGKKS
jgi:Ca-activated chloride channel family protein